MDKTNLLEHGLAGNKPVKNVAIINSTGGIVDTATAAKQDDIIEAIENIPEVDVSTLAKEATLSKLVGFDANDDITTSIVTAGSVKTITETDGVKTLTTVIDSTNPNNKSITETWS